MRVMNIHSAVVKDVKANAFKNVNTNLVINVASKSIKQMLKASVPSYITINKAFTNNLRFQIVEEGAVILPYEK